MKRRLEETVKPIDTSGGYPLSPSPLSPPNPRLPLRTLATGKPQLSCALKVRLSSRPNQLGHH